MKGFPFTSAGADLEPGVLAEDLELLSASDTHGDGAVDVDRELLDRRRVADPDRLVDDADEQRLVFEAGGKRLAFHQSIRVLSDRGHDAVLHEHPVHREALVELQNDLAVHHHARLLLGGDGDEDLDRLAIDVRDDATAFAKNGDEG